MDIAEMLTKGADGAEEGASDAEVIAAVR